MCTSAIARNNPPLKAFAKLINVGFYPHPFILAGIRPNTIAIANTTNMNTILITNRVVVLSSAVAPSK